MVYYWSRMLDINDIKMKKLKIKIYYFYKILNTNYVILNIIKDLFYLYPISIDYHMIWFNPVVWTNPHIKCQWKESGVRSKLTKIFNMIV